jgi:maleate isomerase
MAAPVRIGLLTPSSNTCLEPVASAMLGGIGDVSLHISRIRVASIGLSPGESGQFDFDAMLAAARLLADAHVTVVAWGGTAGSWLGVERDRELAQRLEDELQAPATTSTIALLDALGIYGVRRYGLAVPYTADVAERIVAEYAAQGLECAGRAELGISENFAFDQVPPGQLGDLLREAAPGAEAVAVVCTNLRAAPLVEEFEAATNTVVVDSVVATVWKCLELAGRPAAIEGFGDLARNGSLRASLQSILEALLAATGSSRTTVRLDLPERRLHVDRVAAEAVAPGIRPIRPDASLDQWAMPTVQWLAAEQRTLVQNDVDSDGPPVSPELVASYGVQAQMLQPLVRDGQMFGWISVHEVGETRAWSDADLAAVTRAATHALDALAPE